MTQFELDIVVKNLRDDWIILRMNPFQDSENIVTIQCVLRVYGFRYEYNRAVKILAELKKLEVIIL